MSSSNPDFICPFTAAKVNRDPVTSASNLDVTSSTARQVHAAGVAPVPPAS